MSATSSSVLQNFHAAAAQVQQAGGALNVNARGQFVVEGKSWLGRAVLWLKRHFMPGAMRSQNRAVLNKLHTALSEETNLRNPRLNLLRDTRRSINGDPVEYAAHLKQSVVRQQAQAKLAQAPARLPESARLPEPAPHLRQSVVRQQAQAKLTQARAGLPESFRPPEPAHAAARGATRPPEPATVESATVESARERAPGNPITRRADGFLIDYMTPLPPELKSSGIGSAWKGAGAQLAQECGVGENVFRNAIMTSREKYLDFTEHLAELPEVVENRVPGSGRNGRLCKTRNGQLSNDFMARALWTAVRPKVVKLSKGAQGWKPAEIPFLNDGRTEINDWLAGQYRTFLSQRI